MAEVVDLNERRDSLHTHASGPAVCLGCGHKWSCVSPLPVPTELECPACKTMKGTLEGLINRSAFIWQCQCGNQLFNICPDGAWCPVCGLEVEHGD